MNWWKERWMIKKYKKTSFVAAVVSVLAISLTQSPIAGAAASAQTEHTLTVTSGVVKVFATTTQSFTPTGVTLSAGITNSTTTFFVNNSGNLTVSQFTMTITLPNNSNISAFKRCALNVAFTGANLCAAGSPITLTQPDSGASGTYTISLSGSGFYSFQITQNKTGTMLVSTSASLQNVVTTISNS